MADEKTPAAPKAMTAAEAATAVKRPIVVKEGDKLVGKLVPVKADEVMAFRDCGSHVVVVTTDGQKFSSAPAPAPAEA